MSSAYLAIDFQGGLSEAWTSVATFVPKLVAFLAILLIGWIVARIVAKIVRAILGKIGFDRVVERGGIRDLLARSNYDASDILAKLAYYAILLITLQLGFGVWGPNPVSELLASVVAWLPRLFIALVIIVIIGAIAKGVKTLISNVLGGLSYGGVLGTVASLFVWGLGIIAALNQIGVATTVTTPVLIAVLATVGGVAVVGVGGGLVRPMQERWERWLGNFEAEIPAMKSQAEAYRAEKAEKEAAAARYASAREPMPPPGPGPQYQRHPDSGQYIEHGQFVEQGHYPDQGQYPEQGRFPDQPPYPGQGGGYGPPPRGEYPPRGEFPPPPPPGGYPPQQ